VGDHGHDAAGPVRQEGEVEAVVARVVRQARGLHAPEGLLDVAGGVLDRQDPLVLGQAGEGVVGDPHAGAPGDVVDHDGQVGGLDDRHDVAVDALGAGAVVVGGVDEQALRPGLLGSHPDAHGVGGVVGAGAGHEHGAPADGVADLPQERLLLRQVGGGGLAGGAGQQDHVRPVVDEGDRQGLGRLDVDGAVRGEGGDHGDSDGAEGTGRKSAHGASLPARRARRGGYGRPIASPVRPAGRLRCGRGLNGARAPPPRSRCQQRSSRTRTVL